MGKGLSKRVRREFDADALIRICEADAATGFSDYATKRELPSRKRWRGGADRERFYWFKDNGSSILAVAHLDTVCQNRACTIANSPAGPVAMSGALDDRLGAYVILELLPRLGMTCDWLLTTDEEIGASTADDFDTTKDYNWMISFDRGGSDVVMYDYETTRLRNLVEDSKARVGMGSFSDICSLEHLGCAGFNWGVGYQNYHTQRGHAYLYDTFDMVTKFARFHHVNARNFFEHTQYIYAPPIISAPKTSALGVQYASKPWNLIHRSDDEVCPVCHSWMRDNFCSDCGFDLTRNVALLESAHSRVDDPEELTQSIARATTMWFNDPEVAIERTPAPNETEETA